MSFDVGRHNGNTMSWWRGLPLWLKLLDVVVAVPAWFVIAYCVFTGQRRGLAAYIAFTVFLACAVLHVIADRRPGTGHH